MSLINPLFAELRPSTTIQKNKEAGLKRKAGEEVYNFSFGESCFPTPHFIQDDYLLHGDKNRYAGLTGIQELKEAIAEYYQKNQGLAFKADNVFVGPGSKEVIFHLLYVLNTHFILPAPLWLNIVPQLKLCGKSYALVNTFADGYKLTPDALEKACSQDNSPKTLVLINPNNPTGLSYNDKELADLAAICQRYHLTVLSDEIYELINFEESFSSISKYYPDNTIITNGVSKAQSMGGYRIGYCIIPDALLSTMYEPLLIMAGLTHSGAATPLQYSSINLFRKDQELNVYLANCSYIYSMLMEKVHGQLTGHGISCLKANGSFYLYPNFLNFKKELKRIGIAKDYELTAYLIDNYSIFTTPGSDYYSPSEELSLRLSLVDFDGPKVLEHLADLKEDEEGIYPELFGRIDTGISKLLSFVDELKRG
ncbi:MAG: pyridoxal phosphate-dependent aminotransferase [Candidatus Electrothrix aestuarii]|uniref:Aminotransferase n=1 Tax=Candidatus Electrothrix aestuarii TaxID=3062594 RepID=A0AAU8LSS2_9BACT|nr:pyridoxal phosphate-dependent aminotransferase [Candidatus Electrothrix aestuarii]